ncbi:hypothetical protein [Anaeromyxobacter dehalogenans]|uniref:Uncharacterized protein n=1 Tax=Anaeromyxobacter dehalogenans (strain 2CP-C) TaxID=290397 RepID=Q2IDM6_ANADE|nr:hypothetical protein [Anaeromyxobacter dehalogenans]ABC82686.1 hypothetical protein Adeh_2916 [Anaeromyxobacter dehalogenans 2CP-C]
MSRIGKLLLGIVNLGPIGFMAVAVYRHGDLPASAVAVQVAVVAVLLGIYLRHLAGNDQLTRGLRRGWALVLLAGNWAVFPVYWHQFVWQDPRER